MYVSDDASDVQDFGAQRAGLSVYAVGFVFGRNQVERHAGHVAGTSVGGLLFIYFKIKGKLLLLDFRN